MPEMISDEPLQVAYNGPNAVFEAGVPRFVRPSLVDAALAAGARFVDKETPKRVPPEVATDAQIQEAIQTLLDTGQEKAFGADDKPSVRKLEKLIGAKISAGDRDRVWEGMNVD